MDIKDKIKQLEMELEDAKAAFFRIDGALALARQLEKENEEQKCELDGTSNAATSAD